MNGLKKEGLEITDLATAYSELGYSGLDDLEADDLEADDLEADDLEADCLKPKPLETLALEIIEVKFLLKILEFDRHRAFLSEIKPNSRTSLAKRDRICRTLAEKGLVEYDTEISRFTLSAPGRMLLTLHTTSLPVTPDELKLLRSCKGAMTFEKLGSCVPKEGRSQLINGLVNRKLLKVTQQSIQEVRLTEKGKAFLTVQQSLEIATFSDEPKG
ncbi:MAG: hypothetical protein AAF703_13900 [Cyanobacteria bacterium P01_D01_bin.105]